MIGKIIFTLLSFLLFAYIFLFKLIKKNDTMYLVIIICQAIGILVNLLEIMFSILNGVFFTILSYILCIILPIVVIILELKNINISEMLSIIIAKSLLIFKNRKKAKDVLFNLVTKYDKSYYGHKMLAEIYKEEGGMRKAIDEYVKVLDIRQNDYKSYFKISELLIDLGKKDEAIEMLKTLLKTKPDMCSASLILGDLLLEKENFKDAINVYTNAVKYNKENADLYYNLGIAYSRINEFSIAKKCFSECCNLNSNYYNSYYRLGQIALLYRDINEAEKYFMQSMYGETESKSFYQLAKISMIKNNKVKAAMFLNKSTQINNEFYKKAMDEPIFLPIKSMIEEPEEVKYIESKKEKVISDYLDNTYNLTNFLNKKEKKNNKKSN